MLLNSLLLKDYSTLSKFLTQNQVLKKPVKLHNSQNVNCWSRCEFIRLRIQYGTEISFEIEYHSIKTFQGTFHSVGECLFFGFLSNRTDWPIIVRHTKKKIFVWYGLFLFFLLIKPFIKKIFVCLLSKELNP